jgi:urease accessory protein
MLTVNKLIPRGRGLAAVLLKRAASVELDWDVRQKSRFDATDSTGQRIGVFLPRGSVVRGGDVLVAEDGTLVVVRAAAQQVLVVRQCTQHGKPSDLMRAAYHLGNRHVAVELAGDHLKLEPDHVLEQMLHRMHMIVTRENAPFEPEGGAYEGGHDHGHHDHGHPDHGHPDHGHPDHGHPDHAHDHAPDHAHDRAHHPHGEHGHHDHDHHHPHPGHPKP